MSLRLGGEGVGGGEEGHEASLVGLHVRTYFIDRLPPTQGWNRNGS